MLRDMVSVVSRAHEVNSVGVCKNIMGKCPGSATVSMIRESMEYIVMEILLLNINISAVQTDSAE